MPGAIARWGSFIERDAILMPSFVNIGARVGAETVVVLDVTGGAADPGQVKSVGGLKLRYREDSGGGGRVLLSSPGGWRRAATYAVFVRGGQEGVRGAVSRAGVSTARVNQSQRHLPSRGLWSALRPVTSVARSIFSRLMARLARLRNSATRKILTYSHSAAP